MSRRKMITILIIFVVVCGLWAVWWLFTAPSNPAFQLRHVKDMIRRMGTVDELNGEVRTIIKKYANEIDYQHYINETEPLCKKLCVLGKTVVYYKEHEGYPANVQVYYPSRRASERIYVMDPDWTGEMPDHCDARELVPVEGNIYFCPV
ncbi:MAG: hypothetical protein KC900_05615 [Candidatus Omnitrophica bacterium]|nr:hypothetical protein [Candidatus Omnitrophota bacterium]